MTPRLKTSIEEMAIFCPNLLYAPDPGDIGGWWAGEFRALSNVEVLPELLDDIHHNRAVSTAPGGATRHYSSCTRNHCLHEWMERLRPEELLRAFNVRIFYTGDREDPRCFVEGITNENGRHVWSDGSICPFLSSKHAWNWTRDTIADFVGHVSLWLISWMIFHQTGVWIVGEHSGTPTYHRTHIHPNDNCWCRSGKKYRKCHMYHDEIAIMKGRG